MLYISVYDGSETKKSSEGGHYTLNPGDPNIASIIKYEFHIRSSGTAASIGDHDTASIAETEFDIQSPDKATKAGDYHDTTSIVETEFDIGNRSSRFYPLNNVRSFKRSKTLVLGKLTVDVNDLPINYAEIIYIIVSADGNMRDDIRRAIRGYLTKGFMLKELDYQPR